VQLEQKTKTPHFIAFGRFAAYEAGHGLSFSFVFSQGA
jgi:hypothetical protein